jgi:hypothetical protein
MNKLPVPIALALTLSASVGFACGYIFYSSYGDARTTAQQAIFEAQATQRVLQSYEPILITSKFHQELVAVNTMEDLEALRQKYTDATLRNIDFFERQAGKLELPKERALAIPFLESAATIRGQIERHR